MKTNCCNCGAALSVDRYQDRLQCHYCETVHVPSLREDSLIKKMPEVATNTDCPLCDKALSPAKIDQWSLLYCRGCRGLLLDKESLLHVILYGRQSASEPYRDPEPIRPHQLERQIPCPACRNIMSAHPYYGPGNFVIDACNGCESVWLDGGELSTAIHTRWAGSLWR